MVGLISHFLILVKNLGMKKAKREGSQKIEGEVSPSSSPPEQNNTTWKKRNPTSSAVLSLKFPESADEGNLTIGKRDKSRTFGGEDLPKVVSPRQKANTFGTSRKTSEPESPKSTPSPRQQLFSNFFKKKDENSNSYKSFDEIIEEEEEEEEAMNEKINEDPPVGRERARSYTHPPPFIRAQKPTTAQVPLLQIHRRPGFKPKDEIKYPVWWKKDVNITCTLPCTCTAYASEEPSIPSECMNCGHDAIAHVEVAKPQSHTSPLDKFEIEEEDSFSVDVTICTTSLMLSLQVG